MQRRTGNGGKWYTFAGDLCEIECLRGAWTAMPGDMENDAGGLYGDDKGGMFRRTEQGWVENGTGE